jgi:MerR family transcriptional regulator, thiopeptide resistance regulator
MGTEGYPIGAVAELAKVSVRTLRHYDGIGLLRPNERTAAGHRRYSAADLSRLREILFYRELDFGLEEIAAMLADTCTDDHLRNQHRVLRERITRQQRLLAALEKEMEARDMGLSLSPEEQFEIFGSDRFEQYHDEAEQRWGATDPWTESQRRTTAYTKEDWQLIKAEADANIEGFAAQLRAGRPAEGGAARELAEQHRRHITRWFYDCDYPIHRGLAELYVTDERFRNTYDDVLPGLADYVRRAIASNAQRHEA